MKNYRKTQMIFFISFIHIILFIIMIVILNNKYYYEYYNVSGYYVTKDYYYIFLNNHSYENLQKNNYIYIKNKKHRVKIIEKYKISKKHSQVLIKFKSNINKKLLAISIYKDKKKLLNLFLKCFKED